MSGLAGARLQIIGAALLFSTGGAAIKLSTLSGLQLSGLRCGVAALVFWACLPAARHGFNWRTLLVAVPYAATFILYTVANKTTTAANAIFLQSTAPLYMLLLAPLLLREPVRRADAALLALAGTGLWLIFRATVEPLATAPAPLAGNALAACAGLTWALTILGLRWVAARAGGGREHAAAAVVAGCLLAFVVSGVLEPPLPIPAPRQWVIVAYLGIFQIAFAYLLITRGLARVPALESSLLLLVEPVFAPLWAWWALAEAPPPAVFAGGALIVAATTLRVVAARRAEARTCRPGV